MALGKELLYIIRARDEASKEVNKVKSAFDDANRSADKMGKTLGIASGLLKREVGQSIKAFGQDMLGAVMSFADAGRESIQVSKGLDAVLVSTKGAAGLTAKEIEKMASALQNVTNFQDETIIRGQSMLLTFRNIGKDVFPEATEAMLNFATKMEVDVKTAAVTVGKALQDPLNNLDALSRATGGFTEEQKRMIEGMVASGDIIGAQNVILKELETRFGGAARAAADAKVQLTNSINDIKEEIGKTLLPALDSAAKAVLPLIQRVNEWIAANPELAKTIGLIVAAVGLFLTVGGSLIVMLGTLAAALAVIGVTLAVGGALFLAIGGITSLVIVMTQHWEGLRWMVTNAVQEMKDAVSNFAVDLAEKFGLAEAAAKRLITTLKNAAKEALNATISSIPVVGPVLNAVRQRATGGSSDEPLTLVGERGPELVSLPRGSFVNTAAQTRDMLGQRGISMQIGNVIGEVHVYREADENRLAKKVEDVLTRILQIGPLAA